jgi:hypothetical protein
LTKTLSLDDNRVTVIEKVVLTKYAICYRPIKDIRFPKYASIAAIYRNYQIIIPSGSIVIEPKDTLVMVTAPNNAKALLKYVETERTSPLKPILGAAVGKSASESKPESKPEPKMEPKPEPKPEPKMEPKPARAPKASEEPKPARPAPAPKKKPAKPEKPVAKKK